MEYEARTRTGYVTDKVTGGRTHASWDPDGTTATPAMLVVVERVRMADELANVMLQSTLRHVSTGRLR